MTLFATCLDQEYQIRIQEKEGLFSIRIEGPGGEKTVPVRCLSKRDGCWTLEVDGRIQQVLVTGQGQNLQVEWMHHVFPVRVTPLHRQRARSAGSAAAGGGGGEVRARMPGTVIRVLVSPGQEVEVGQGLVIIEAMKMQNQIASPASGRVSQCGVGDGQAVNTGDLLFQIE